MSFKIYQYSSLLQWKNSDFLDEIKEFPHICAGKSFGDVLKSHLFTTLSYCTLEDFCQDLGVFWGSDTEKSYDIFGEICHFFREKQEYEAISPEDYAEFSEHFWKIYQVVELLFLLECSPVEHKEEGGREGVFWELLLCLQEKFSDISEYSLDFEDTQDYLRRAFPYHSGTVKGIVVHSVLEYPPEFLRCLWEMEKSGLEIVFLLPTGGDSLFFTPWETVYEAFPGERIVLEEPEAETGESLLKHFHQWGDTGKKFTDISFKSETQRFFTTFLPCLYGLWQEDSQEIAMDWRLIKECLFSAPVTQQERKRLVKSYYKLEFLWKHLDSYEKFSQVLGEGLLTFRENGEEEFPFQLLAMYHEDTLPLEDLRLFVDCITAFQQFSFLFFQDSPSLLTESLERMRILSSAGQEELCHCEEGTLVQCLQEQQKKHLEGGFSPLTNLFLEKLTVFSSENSQFSSRRKMGQDSWGLYEDGSGAWLEFLKKACELSPFGEICRSSYESQARFSSYLPVYDHVRREYPQEEEVSSYFTMAIPAHKIMSVAYDRVQSMTGFLCPFRYFLTYVLEESPVFWKEPAYEQFYEHLLVEDIWKNFQGKPLKEVEGFLWDLLQQVDEKYRGLFPYLGEKQRVDARIRAGVYLKNSIFLRGKSDQVREFAPSHMEMMWKFGEASFQQDILDDKQSLPVFASLESKDFRYSLHKVPKLEEKSLWQIQAIQQGFSEYLNNKELRQNHGTWCEFCPHKSVCDDTNHQNP